MSLFKENPMHNEMILENIFQYLPVNDLKNVRIMCHLWKKASLAQWRKSGVLVLKQTNENDSREMEKCLSITRYWTLMWNGKTNGLKLMEKPFRKYKLIYWVFSTRSFTQELSLFQDKCGGITEYISFYKCTIYHHSVLDNLLTQHLPRLYKMSWYDSKFEYERRSRYHDPAVMRLERLRLHFQQGLKVLEVVVDHELLYNFDGPPVEFARLLCGFPNTCELVFRQADDGMERRITLEHEDTKQHRQISSIFKEIAYARLLRNGVGPNIQSLDMMDLFTDAVEVFSYDKASSHMQSLPFLENLEIDVGYNTAPAEISQIFSSNGNTLQTLKAFRAPFMTAGLYKHLPLTVVMEKLCELHLCGNFTSNLDFLRYTPNLQTLILKSDCYDKWYKLRSRLSGCGSGILVLNPDDFVESTTKLFRSRGAHEENHLVVKSLEHLYMDCELSPDSIVQLAKWIPNVKTLQLVLKNNTLRAVCKAWPDLKELECLFGSNINDNGVSGLKLLKDLGSFQSNSYCNKGRLSSASVEKVFLKMRNLTNLNICVSKMMSPDAEEALKRQISQVTVIRNYDDDRKHRHECCDRMNFQFYFLKIKVPLPQPLTSTRRQASTRTKKALMLTRIGKLTPTLF